MAILVYKSVYQFRKFPISKIRKEKSTEPQFFTLMAFNMTYPIYKWGDLKGLLGFYLSYPLVI